MGTSASECKQVQPSCKCIRQRFAAAGEIFIYVYLFGLYNWKAEIWQPHYFCPVVLGHRTEKMWLPKITRQILLFFKSHQVTRRTYEFSYLDFWIYKLIYFWFCFFGISYFEISPLKLSPPQKICAENSYKQGTVSNLASKVFNRFPHC